MLHFQHHGDLLPGFGQLLGILDLDLLEGEVLLGAGRPDAADAPEPALAEVRLEQVLGLELGEADFGHRALVLQFIIIFE